MYHWLNYFALDNWSWPWPWSLEKNTCFLIRLATFTCRPQMAKSPLLVHLPLNQSLISTFHYNTNSSAMWALFQDVDGWHKVYHIKNAPKKFDAASNYKYYEFVDLSLEYYNPSQKRYKIQSICFSKCQQIVQVCVLKCILFEKKSEYLSNNNCKFFKQFTKYQVVMHSYTFRKSDNTRRKWVRVTISLFAIYLSTLIHWKLSSGNKLCCLV